MNLFSQLRQHAHDTPESLAAASRHRKMTYRKLWSRVERATARLQCEWKVDRGDRVAYWGQAHPDALVLYIALARCGAQLVALEDPALQPRIGLLMQELNAGVLVHDDDRPVEHADPKISIKPLSSLIGTRCPHHPWFLNEQTNQNSLVLVHGSEPENMRISLHALDRLTAESTTESATAPLPQPCITDQLFDQTVFSSVVLPTLMAGRMLVFR